MFAKMMGQNSQPAVDQKSQPTAVAPVAETAAVQQVGEPDAKPKAKRTRKAKAKTKAKAQTSPKSKPAEDEAFKEDLPKMDDTPKEEKKQKKKRRPKSKPVEDGTPKDDDNPEKDDTPEKQAVKPIRIEGFPGPDTLVQCGFCGSECLRKNVREKSKTQGTWKCLKCCSSITKCYRHFKSMPDLTGLTDAEVQEFWVKAQDKSGKGEFSELTQSFQKKKVNVEEKMYE